MADYRVVTGSRAEFSLAISKEDLQKARKGALEHFRKNVKIDGFRAGHVPDEAVIGRVGDMQLSIEAIERAINKKYREFVTTHELRVVDSPKIDFPQAEPSLEKDFNVKVQVDIYPEVKVGDYKKIKMPELKVEIKKEQIQEVLTQLIIDRQAGALVSRKSKTGDLVEIDFAGYDDKGEIIANTNANNYWLNLGSGTFLPDLEKGIIGMEAKETKEKIMVEFPADYPAEALKGQKVPFTVTVHQVQEVDPKKLGDEQREKIAGKKISPAELEEQITTQIQIQQKGQQIQQRRTEYEAKLLKICQGDIPASWIEAELNGRLRQMQAHPHFAKDPNHIWSHLGAKDEAEWRGKTAPEITNNLKIFLGLSQIVDQEKIELDKDEQEKVEGQIAQAKEGDNPQQLRQHFTLGARIDKYIRSVTL